MAAMGPTGHVPELDPTGSLKPESTTINDNTMVELEATMMNLIDQDVFLKEKSASEWTLATPACLPRVVAWRTGTELLGSIDAVEDRQEKIGQALTCLEQMGAALGASARQWKGAHAALEKARKAERAMEEKEADRARKLEKARQAKAAKLQKELAADKTDQPENGPKRRRQPGGYITTEDDPPVLAVGWRQLSVVETFAPLVSTGLEV